MINRYKSVRVKLFENSGTSVRFKRFEKVTYVVPLYPSDRFKKEKPAVQGNELKPLLVQRREG